MQTKTKISVISTVLVSDKVGCVVDLVKNGGNGYIFESGNEESVNSVLIQDCDNYEFLICDDDLSDERVEFLESFNNNRIRLIRSNKD